MKVSMDGRVEKLSTQAHASRQAGTHTYTHTHPHTHAHTRTHTHTGSHCGWALQWLWSGPLSKGLPAARRPAASAWTPPIAPDTCAARPCVRVAHCSSITRTRLCSSTVLSSSGPLRPARARRIHRPRTCVALIAPARSTRAQSSTHRSSWGMAPLAPPPGPPFVPGIISELTSDCIPKKINYSMLTIIIHHSSISPFLFLLLPLIPPTRFYCF